MFILFAYRSEMPHMDPGAFLRVLGSQAGGGQARGQAVGHPQGVRQCPLERGPGHDVEQGGP